MNTEKLKNLLKYLKNTAISEITIASKDTQISIKRDINSIIQKPEQEEELEPPPTIVEQPKVPEIEKFQIKSNTVGIFYRGKTKGGPPCVKLGEIIQKGTQLGIIETLGVSQAVISGYSGKIVEILVDNHHPVQYGQVLFEIEAQK